MSDERIRTIWYILMVVGGFAFGLLGERRPFGQGILTHPVVVYFVVVAIGLLIARFAMTRPVSEVIPDRALMTGCLSGVAAFLFANFVILRLFGA